MPKMYIISGCNGSGKTTASYTVLPELLRCSEFVNSDEFAKSLSPLDPSAASVSASRFMLMKINYLLSRNEDFCVETTLATRSLLHIIQKAQSEGYETTLIYFWLASPQIAMERVRARVQAGGHNIPDEVVRRRYVMGLSYFFDTYSHICDRWVLADNTNSPFTIVAEKNGNVTDIRDNEKYRLIWNSIHIDDQI